MLPELQQQSPLSHGVPEVVKHDGKAWTWDKIVNVSFENGQFEKEHCYWYCWLGLLLSPTPSVGKCPALDQKCIKISTYSRLIAWIFSFCDGETPKYSDIFPNKQCLFFFLQFKKLVKICGLIFLTPDKVPNPARSALPKAAQTFCLLLHPWKKKVY